QIRDGSSGDDIVLHTEANATFAGYTLPALANEDFEGVPLLINNVKQLWPQIAPAIQTNHAIEAVFTASSTLDLYGWHLSHINDGIIDQIGFTTYSNLEINH